MIINRLTPLKFIDGCLVAVGLTALLITEAVAQSGGDLDYDVLLEQLEQLTEQREQLEINSAKSAYDTIKAAASSQTEALKLYYEAVMKIQYSGKTRENSQLREWKKKEDDTHEERNFREGLRLHLIYLALSIKRAQMEPDDQSILKELESYANSVLDLDDELRNEKSWMQKSVASSEIAKAYNLDSYLPEENWELVPGNADGMYEKTLLPLMREQKSPYLISYWDNRIARKQKELSDIDGTFQKENILNNEIPTMMWQRANEYYIIDRPAAAVQAKFSIVNQYRAHDSFDKWVEELQADLLALKAGQPVGAILAMEETEEEAGAEQPLETVN